jgi:hypothetical protein
MTGSGQRIGIRLSRRPPSLSPGHAEACLPGSEVNPD